MDAIVLRIVNPLENRAIHASESATHLSRQFNGRAMSRWLHAARHDLRAMVAYQRLYERVVENDLFGTPLALSRGCGVAARRAVDDDSDFDTERFGVARRLERRAQTLTRGGLIE